MPISALIVMVATAPKIMANIIFSPSHGAALAHPPLRHEGKIAPAPTRPCCPGHGRAPIQ